MILTLFKNIGQLIWIMFLNLGFPAVSSWLDSDYEPWARKSCVLLSASHEGSHSLNLPVPFLVTVTLISWLSCVSASFLHCKLITFLFVGNKCLVGGLPWDYVSVLFLIILLPHNFSFHWWSLFGIITSVVFAKWWFSISSYLLLSKELPLLHWFLFFNYIFLSVWNCGYVPSSIHWEGLEAMASDTNKLTWCLKLLSHSDSRSGPSKVPEKPGTSSFLESKKDLSKPGSLKGSLRNSRGKVISFNKPFYAKTS